MGRSIRSIRFLAFAFLILTTSARAAAQTHAKGAGESKPTPQNTPAPAATARAVAKALTDAKARRKAPRGPQPERPMIPVEKRWHLVWPTPETRVALSWPAADTSR
jgi:hypothetical protein